MTIIYSLETCQFPPFERKGDVGVEDVLLGILLTRIHESCKKLKGVT